MMTPSRNIAILLRVNTAVCSASRNSLKTRFFRVFGMVFRECKQFFLIGRTQAVQRLCGGLIQAVAQLYAFLLNNPITARPPFLFRLMRGSTTAIRISPISKPRMLIAA